MQYKQLGTTEIKLSSIIFGAWQAGKNGWVGVDDDETKDAMRVAIDLGMSTIDTAAGYGEGHSERLVGEVIKGRRDDVVILTKVGPEHFRPEQVRASCERSLQNLRVDSIDLYQLHWPSGAWGHPYVPADETMAEMLKLQSEGKFKYIGVSNYSAAQLSEALHMTPVEAIQPPYSLFWRHYEQDAGPLALERNVTTIAYSPLAQGLLTGKFQRGHVFEAGDNRARNKMFSGELYEKAQVALDQLRPIAESLSLTLGQLALAWVAAQPKTCAIAGARNAEQVRQNAVAGDISLDAATLDKMDKISHPVVESAGDDPMQWSAS